MKKFSKSEDFVKIINGIELFRMNLVPLCVITRYIRAEKENYYENEKNHQRGACLRSLRADVCFVRRRSGGEQGGTKAPEGAKLEKLTKTAFEFDAPALPGTKSKELLENPDRGFRHELGFLAKSFADKGDLDRDFTAAVDEMIALYADDKPQLAQVYVYLTDSMTEKCHGARKR